ncbi:MAG: TetR/AcrR family transcriptional regulator [Desulfobacterales bacterium]|nr:MAG: TetR/AcrR family transcriptional regulator [Desulfobacterales bacterium]
MGIAERKKREKKMLEKMRVKQIQEAAIAVFMNKGFNSATMEDIAGKAELSPATIYLYFRNKDELYCSLNLLTLQYLHDQIERVYTDDSLSVEEKIFGFKDAMYKTFLYNPTNLRMIFHVQLNSVHPTLDKEFMAKLNSVGKRLMNLMASVYEEGVRQGKFVEGHGMVYSDIMWSLFSGLVLWEGAKVELDARKDFLKSTLDTAFAVFAEGIKKMAAKPADCASFDALKLN